MFNLIKSQFSLIKEREVAAGVNVSDEGLVLVHKLEGGVGKAALPTPAATEIVIGFAISDVYNNAQKAAAESHVVPASAPYTVTLNQVVPVGGSFRIADVTASADLVNGNPANPGEYSVLGNVVTFNVAQHGHSVVVYYQYNLTVADAQQRYYDRNINRKASQVYNQVAYGCGQGQIYLDNFDTTKDYSSMAVGQGLIVLAGGIVSKGTLAGALELSAHVIHLPSVDEPQLGLEYTILNM